MPPSLSRRDVLVGAGAALLGTLPGCGGALRGASTRPAAGLVFAPLRATPDRITRIALCTRPFRAQAVGEDDYYDFGDPSANPDRAEAERAVSTIGRLCGDA